MTRAGQWRQRSCRPLNMRELAARAERPWLPTTEKSAKNKNLKDCKEAGAPGVVGYVHLGKRRHFANHGLAVCIPRAYHEPVENLIQPKFMCQAGEYVEQQGRTIFPMYVWIRICRCECQWGPKESKPTHPLFKGRQEQQETFTKIQMTLKLNIYQHWEE